MSQTGSGRAHHLREPGISRLAPSQRNLLAPVLVLLALLLLAPPAQPQGCTQCRDNAAATPPSTQRAYRRAIVLLALTAGGIFLGTVTLLRRNH